MKKRNVKTIQGEEWREVDFSEGKYKVSNFGRMKSFHYDKEEGRILKQCLIKGFATVSLIVNKKSKTYFVHKLVAQAFIPKDNEDQSIVTHVDGKVLNNHIDNLKWQTKEENYKMILKKLHEKNRGRKGVITNSKLKEKDVALLKSMLNKGITQSYLAKMFCISEMQVTRIKRGDNWAHVKPLDD